MYSFPLCDALYNGNAYNGSAQASLQPGAWDAGGRVYNMTLVSPGWLCGGLVRTEGREWRGRKDRGTGDEGGQGETPSLMATWLAQNKP